MDDQQNQIYKLVNDNGLVIGFLAYGARITTVKMPSSQGLVDIALGYDTPEQSIKGDTYIGAICGRFANRISNGGFHLNGKFIKLAQNDRTNQLHGGPNGFNKKTWTVEPIVKSEFSSAYQLTMVSPDGDENYPGELTVTMIYALNNQNEFLIEFNAQSSKTTIVNLTSHPYFNLNGVGKGKIFNHVLQINANEFTPLNQMSVPTGEFRKVAGTDMDFNKPVKLGDVINSSYEQIAPLEGIDHNWVINKPANEIGFAVKITEPESGRSVEVYTTQPGIQVYTSMHFDGSEVGKGGIPITQYAAIALEAQNFPDAPNRPEFPSSVLNAGETYHQKIMYKFGF